MVQVTDLCLKLLEENPSLVLDQRNASLVQNMNGREDVGGVIEVLHSANLHCWNSGESCSLSWLQARVDLRVRRCRAVAACN